MSEFTPKHFWAYRCFVSWNETKAALADLVQAKKTVMATGIPTVEKLYRYVDALAALAGKSDEGDVIATIDHETVRFLDTGLVWQWLRTPDDAEIFNDLTIQLMMLSAATGVYDASAKPYTLKEVAAMADGERAAYYHDMTFLKTLRHAIGPDGSDDYGMLLFATLPKFEDGEDIQATYGWDDALTFSLLLQTVWKSFPFLDIDEQKFLLQHYLYTGIVAGVPVRAWIGEVLGSDAPGVDYKNINMLYLQAMLGSMERVPYDTEDEGGERYADILKDFFAVASGEQISTLAQEKFVQSLYKDQPESDYFESWMREALSIALALKSGKWAAH